MLPFLSLGMPAEMLLTMSGTFIDISKLKWAWQAQFLSHILIILKNNVFFEDKQMILLPLFDIYTGFRFTKNLNSCSIQFWSHPWLYMGSHIHIVINITHVLLHLAHLLM